MAATLYLGASTANFKYDGNYTTGRLAYTWSWSGVPVFKMQDAVAASWNDWAVTSQSSSVNYYVVNTGSFYSTQAATYSSDGNGTKGAGHKFKVAIGDNYYYAKSGSGYFQLQSDVHAKKDFYYYIAYGHSQIFATINFSIGVGGGSASISFTTGTVIEDYVTGNYKF